MESIAEQARCFKSTRNSMDSSKKSKCRLSQKVKPRKTSSLYFSNSARRTARVDRIGRFVRDGSPRTVLPERGRAAN